MSDLVDRPESWEVVSHRVKAAGRVQTFIEDEILSPQNITFTRQYVEHPGAVAVMALDQQGRVAVVDQYRHPVRHRLIEPPAGLLDIDGENYLVAAQRELAEEARLQAADWRVLVDLFTSPGGLGESLRIYLARELSPAPLPEGFVVEDEEADMAVHWMPLDEIVAKIYAGQLQGPTMMAGALSLALAISRNGLDTLRPADAPWPARESRP